MALVIAMVMVLAMSVPAFAESGARTVDSKITVSGLQDGDTVNYYKILKWDNGWKVNSPFVLTDEELATVVGNKTTPGAISYALAQKLAGQISSNEASAKYGPLTAASGKAEQAEPEAGLYMGIITPAKSGYVYNPVFVAADYDQPASGDTSSWAVDLEKSYSDEAYAKKQEITLEKTAEDQTTVDENTSETVAVGDKVDFEVTTVVPGFKDKNYPNPVFKITDALSTGLELDLNSVTVTAPTGLTKGNQYSVTEQGNGYVLSFTANYLNSLAAPTDVKISYSATVTEAAKGKNINQEDNTVTLNYSNNPSDEEGHGTLKDKTNHYTFDIDGDLFGSTPYKATEIVKVGVDKDGNEITETRTLDNGNTVGALEGAQFKLYKTESDAIAKNDKQIKTASSDEDGRINIQGLDAGTYWLVETRAPAGYIAATDPVKIEIVPTIEEVTVTEGTGNDAVTYKTNILTAYSVKVNDVTTATYTVTPEGTVTTAEGKKTISYENAADATKIKEVDQGDKVGDTNVGDDANSGKIKNTQGVALPSTGGIGTTIFYLVGTILVLGAGILLITRRRMSAK